MKMGLLSLLDRYRPLNARDLAQAARLRLFVASDPRCFERSNPLGHVTGSAWLVDPSGSRVLLTHHKKLGKWLQVGGHADGERDVLAVALREAREETGIANLEPLSEEIFDLDIHRIPAHGVDPEHDHFDIRFAIRAGETVFTVSDESNELAWVEIDRLSEYTQEESMLRMARKWLKQRDEI
jgi:8-oxo-dGTP pyrophosphatase MutT (NUDIX family)